MPHFTESLQITAIALIASVPSGSQPLGSRLDGDWSLAERGAVVRMHGDSAGPDSLQVIARKFTLRRTLTFTRVGARP